MLPGRGPVRVGVVSEAGELEMDEVEGGRTRLSCTLVRFPCSFVLFRLFLLVERGGHGGGADVDPRSGPGEVDGRIRRSNAWVVGLQ
jgi:hypothetical protein